MNFKSKQLQEFRKSKALLIDVRSPDEYYKGHLPNSINIPLFDNEERKFIGKKYKNAGREKAVVEGLKIIEKKLDFLIYNFISAEKDYIAKENNESIIKNKIKIYCARGGMRSLSISWLLEKMNFNTFILNGGYKNYRKWVLSVFNKKQELIVVGGKTGTGKTRLLNHLKKNNYQVIDLEFLANHRGSTFGGLGMKEQPSNEQFENLIAENIDKLNQKEKIFLEAESSNIGKCRIPFEFFKQMKKAPRIEIIQTQENRIRELISTYSVFSKNDLRNSVNRLTKRLGPKRTKNALDSIDKENWEGVCRAVLEYYDKCYEYELKDKLNVTTIKINGKDENEIIQLIINKSLSL